MVNFISSDFYEIYPNPGTDLVKIYGPSEFKLTLFNQLGEAVAIYTNAAEISVESLENGLYFFKFEDKSRSTIIKFVKN